MQPYFELRKRRELGEILSDSFSFARINFKTLFPILIRTTGVFFLIHLLLTVVYQYATMENMAVTDTGLFFGSLLLVSIGSLLYYASASAGIYSFMANYLETKGQINESQIIQSTWSKMVSLLVLSLMAYILFIVGFIFFVIPGIYFLIPVALCFPVFIFQKLGKRESIKKSFKLVSGYWWVTFGTLLVVGIVIGIISVVFSLPPTIYLSIKTLMTESTSSVGMGRDFVFLILSTISSAVSNLLSIFIIIAVGLIYFDLDEEKNKTGIRAKLEDLG